MNGSNNRKKRRTRWFSVILVVFLLGFFLVSIEAVSFLILVVLKQNFYLPLALRDKAQIESMASADAILADNAFSRELGWEPRSDNPHGYRGPEKNVDDAAVALFGDSFTLAYSPIEQSWPHLLEVQLGRPVLNFGVGGYGADQAYWRFKERYLGTIQTPYVALNIMSENIARNLSLYRGFYNRRADLAATKPRFYPEADGRVVHIENPLRSKEELSKLSDVDFLKSIGEKDYWYQHFDQYDLNEMVGFPYSYYFLKALPYYVGRFYMHRIQDDAPYKDLYSDEEPVEILRFIIDSFIQDAESAGSVPVIVFLPNWMDMDDVVHKRKKPAYDAFFQQIKAEYPATFDGMSYFLPYFDRGEPISDFFQSRTDGHYNALGDKVVSEGFYRDLMAVDAERGLLARSAGSANP